MKNNQKKKLKIDKKKVLSTVAFFCVVLSISLFIYFLQKDKNVKGSPNELPIEKNLNSDYKNDLKVHMVDVGQGDSVIIELPNGQYFLIDSGPSSSSNRIFSYIDDVLKITKIDYVLVTHPDSDHIGAMPQIFERYEIGHVFRPYVYYENNETKYDFPQNFNQGTIPKNTTFEETVSYFNFLKSLLNEDCSYEFFNFESDLSINLKLNNSENSVCYLDFLSPLQNVGEELIFTNTNNYSPIIMLSFLNKRFMFCGDVDSNYEEDFLKKYSDVFNLDIDVLKVSHHGSRYSTSSKFLSFIKPEYAFISCGKNNIYAHPNQEVLNSLLNSSTLVYRTDLNGHIVATVSSDGSLSITSEKTASFSELYESN